jgi:hypothetical protein
MCVAVVDGHFLLKLLFIQEQQVGKKLLVGHVAILSQGDLKVNVFLSFFCSGGYLNTPQNKTLQEGPFPAQETAFYTAYMKGFLLSTCM